MKKLFTFLVLLMVTLGLNAQDLTIKGHVIRSEDSVNAYNVRVKAMFMSDTSVNGIAYTDSLGNYSITLTPPAGVNSDTIEVTFVDSSGADYESYYPYVLGDTILIADYAVKYCDTKDQDYATLTISGNVVDTNGVPVEDVPVEAAFDNSGGPVKYGSTDKYGNFKLVMKYTPNVDKSLTLKVQDFNGNVQTKNFTIDYNYEPYYITDQDFKIVNSLGLYVAVTGKVYNDNGDPVANAGVEVQYGKYKFMRAYTNTDSDGSYILRLKPPFSGYDTIRIITYDGQGELINTEVFDGSSYLFNDDIDLRDSVVYSAYKVAAQVMTKDSVAAHYLPVAIIGVGYDTTYLRTDNYGEFIGYVFAPYNIRLPIKIDVKDACGNILTDTLSIPQGDLATDYLNLYLVDSACAGVPSPGTITFYGTVKDTAGNPVPDIKLRLVCPMTDGPFGTSPLTITTDSLGNYKATVAVPPISVNYYIGLKDGCGRLYVDTVNFDFSQYTFESNFQIVCTSKVLYTLQGYVRDSSGNPLPGVKIVAQEYVDDQSQESALSKAIELPSDSASISEAGTGYIETVTNDSGYYKIVAPAPSHDTILVIAQDGCQNTQTDTLYFDPDVLTYTKDFVLSCAGEYEPDIKITGMVYDTTGKPLPDVVVGAFAYETGYYRLVSDSLSSNVRPRFFGISDSLGRYKIRMPLLRREDTIYVVTMDSLDSIYVRKIYFDFNQYRFDSVDFALANPPKFTVIRPLVFLGIRHGWKHYRRFRFYAHLVYARHLVPSYYKWIIGTDTVVTDSAYLDYKFDFQNDTCVKVKVRAFVGRLKITSPPVRVCIRNPFRVIKDSVYTDFVISKLTAASFNFIPVVLYPDDYVIESARWDFGDTTSYIPDSATEVVEHHYLYPGRYIVHFTVKFKNSLGQEDSIKWRHPVWAGTDTWYPDSCAATFYPIVDSSNSLSITFKNISYPGDTSKILYYYWDFGDSTNSTLESPTHIFEKSGKYPVSLKILTSSGCYDQFTLNISVGDSIEPLMIYPDTLGNDSTKAIAVKFHNISGRKIDKSGWDFGEAEKKGDTLYITSSDTVIHYYPDTGYYNVTMVDMNTGASITMKIHVVSNDQVIPIEGLLTAPSGVSLAPKVEQVKKLTLYPNPATNYVILQLNKFAKQSQISIINVNGQIVKRIVQLNSNRLRINVKDLSQGTYFIRVNYDGKIGIAKFVKE